MLPKHQQSSLTSCVPPALWTGEPPDSYAMQGIFNPFCMKAQADCLTLTCRQTILAFVLITMSRENFSTSPSSCLGKRSFGNVHLPQHSEFPSSIPGPLWKPLKGLLFSCFLHCTPNSRHIHNPSLGPNTCIHIQGS